MAMADAHVAKWLRALGGLCAGSMPAEEVAGKVNAYAAMLVTRFPIEAFNPTSLEEVAAKCKFFPAYGELTEHLGTYWRDNRPNRFQALPAPQHEERQPPSEAERAAQARTMQAFMEEIGNRAKERAKREPVKPAYLSPTHLAEVRKGYGRIT